ncbi:MAG: T9SS type A sorting domain-containing protein [Saprospirales bacterium]|nr:T9SS type A sorting domain-containing protein [Saprospirales bacterium]
MNVRFFLLFATLFSLPVFGVFSQGKYDNVWVIGHGGEGMIFDFSAGPPTISPADLDIYHYSANASICDSTGNLLFYTNGVYIADSTHQPMENSFIDLGLLTGSPNGGVNTPQIVLILPQPGNPGIYYLLYKALYYVTPQSFGSKFYYSIIDMSLNSGLGGVLEKDHLVMEGVYLHWGQITACRHANGRDWWILLAEANTNRYFKFILSPTGLEEGEIQEIGAAIPIGVGQAVFSPDGTKYTRLDLVDLETGGFIDIYDFDRCQGLLSNQIQIHYIDSSGAGGMAFSPNSKLLYVPSQNHIFQYDMEASDIPASKEIVGVYDGFMSPFWASFYMAQLAPDGKIYVNAPNGVDVMHVINNPNEPGLACDFAQHSIELPAYNAFSLPNYPYFNLGALEGSPCDTLGPTPVAEVPAPEFQVRLFPNPVEEDLHFHFSQPLQGGGVLRIFDAMGREVQEVTLPAGQREVQVCFTAPAGVYFYEIENGGGDRVTGRLVKG